jgi:hypothetical protein
MLTAYYSIVKNHIVNAYAFFLMPFISIIFIITFLVVFKNSMDFRKMLQSNVGFFTILLALYNIPIILKKYLLAAFNPFGSLFIVPAFIESKITFLFYPTVFFLFLLIYFWVKFAYKDWPLKKV